MTLSAHLLQSTLFAAAVWLTTLALRRHHARIRHGLWMAASIKFLLPFSLLVSLGSHLIPPTAPPTPPPQMRFVMAETAVPVPLSVSTQAVRPVAPVRPDPRPPVLWWLWGCGCAVVLIRWCIRWHRASVDLRESVSAGSSPGFPPLPVAACSCPTICEPGVFGIFRPVLLLPAGIAERLSSEQLQAVIAHEMCHIRRGDNLAAAVHMLVEALFWFHPLVWWIGARLLDERERACDEEVLERGADPSLYAESILRVCRFYLESAVPCVSGITGANLQQRIRDIMAASTRRPLGPRKKFLLAAMGAAVVAVPLAVGLAHPPNLRAQAIPQTAAPLRFDVASVKVSNQEYVVLFPERSGGRIRWTTDLWYILSYAYRLQPWRISGPVPGSESIYSVDAATAPNATDDQVRLMFQSLLIDRFKMAVHRVTKDVDGYALTVAKNGPKMQEAREGEIPPMPERFSAKDTAVLEGKVVAMILSRGVAAITGRRATMLQLSEGLQRVLRLPVLDQTSLTGKYYFDLQYATGDDPDAPFPSLLSAVKDLGLKLERRKGPVEMLVVDRIEKTPTEN